MLSFGQEESGDCSSSICLEHMVSRVSVTPRHETIAEAVDVIVYLKLKDYHNRTWLSESAIARLEKMNAAPQVSTLLKVLKPLGYTLAIVPDR